MRKTAFVRDGWSFRPDEFRPGLVRWIVRRKGERWAEHAWLYPASDGRCFLISMNQMQGDARPSFEEAVALVVERLNKREGKAHD